MKIGDEVYIHGYIDEIRKDTIIIKNEGGYFGTILSEITDREQEPCEDCIDRADAMTEIMMFAGNKKHDDDIYVKVSDVVQLLRELPSVQPEPKTGWIPVKTRPMTEEETEHYFEYTDMRIDDTYTILDCPLPDDGQEVLVSWGGNVMVDVFIRDDADGCYFEGVDIDEVDAWMPLPECYEESEE